MKKLFIFAIINMRFLLLLNVVICYCAVVAVDLEVHGLVSDDIEYDDNEEQISSGSGDVENEIEAENEQPLESSGDKKSEVKKPAEIIPEVMNTNNSTINSTSSNVDATTPPVNATASNNLIGVTNNDTATLNATLVGGNINNTANATNAITQKASKRGKFLEGVKPIGKMETLEITINGSTHTKNSKEEKKEFMKVAEDTDGIPSPSSRLDFIKVRGDSNAIPAVTYNYPTSAAFSKTSKRHHRHHHHRRHHKHSKRHHHGHHHKQHKKSTPASQLYKKSSIPDAPVHKRSPLSKTIEEMLAAKTNSRRQDIPDEERDEQMDMKSSGVERLPGQTSTMFNANTANDGSEYDDEEEEMNEQSARRSNTVAAPAATLQNESKGKSSSISKRKYSVKGYIDKMEVPTVAVKKSTTKQSNMKGVKKSGSTTTELTARGEIGEEAMHDQISDFVKQMSNSPFAPQIPRSPVKSSVGKSSKDQYNIAKSYKVKDGTSPAIMKNKNQLKPKKDKFAPTAMNEDDETDEDDDKEDDGNSSSGEEENEKNDEKNEEKQNDNEDEEMDGDEENDGGEVPPVGDGPVPQNKKRPTQDQGTPPPVVNVPKPLLINVPPPNTKPAGNEEPLSGSSPEKLPPTEFGPSKLPSSAPGPVVLSPPVTDRKPTGLVPDVSLSPFPFGDGELSPPPLFPPKEKAESEIMKKIEENSQNVESLYQRFDDLEGKEMELERAMGDIGAGLERIEKKLDTQQNKLFAPPPFLQQPPPSPPAPSPPLPMLKRPSLEEFRNIPQRLPMRPLLMNNGVGLLKKRPRILKQIFIPLPPKNSLAAKEIEAGAPISSPVLDRLPFPIRMIVSQIFRQQLKDDKRLPFGGTQSSAMEPDVPPREHDIDKLELELGRIPISRHGSFLSKSSPVKPKIFLFSKAPTFLDLLEKPCRRPCQNGGRCLGSNVCKCRPGFTGTRCEVFQFPRPTLVEIIRAKRPIVGEEFENGEKSNKISLPFVLSDVGDDNDEDEEQQKTAGYVNQSKLVNILRRFSMPFDDLYKRNTIPPQFRYYRENYADNNRQIYRRR